MGVTIEITRGFFKSGICFIVAYIIVTVQRKKEGKWSKKEWFPVKSLHGRALGQIRVRFLIWPLLIRSGNDISDKCV